MLLIKNNIDTSMRVRCISCLVEIHNSNTLRCDSPEVDSRLTVALSEGMLKFDSFYSTRYRGRSYSWGREVVQLGRVRSQGLPLVCFNIAVGRALWIGVVPEATVNTASLSKLLQITGAFPVLGWLIHMQLGTILELG